MNREIGELKIGIKNGFRRIKEDMEDVKKLVKKKDAENIPNTRYLIFQRTIVEALR